MARAVHNKLFVKSDSFLLYGVPKGTKPHNYGSPKSFMDLHNSIMEIRNSIMEIHHSIMEIRNSIMEIHN